MTGTSYDMTAMLMPQLHTSGNVRAETGFYERVLKRADGLIAISASAKNDAVELLRIQPDRIAVIHPGIDERFFSPQDILQIQERYQLTKPYLLFVGTIEPRKNVDALLDAYSALPAAMREAHDLVVAGPIGWAAGVTVDRLKQGMPGLRLLGYIPEQDLPALTAAASIFVYPSFYEGFGFPVAQAMAAGVPVITSNLSSLPEVVGDAGLLIDPKSVEDIKRAMSKLLTSPALREKLGRNGAEQAKRFTWKNSARLSAEFFQG
ncbi:MAG: glycosyltransferase family 1 protein [Bryobacteraceae bacterium]